ncbi:uncharacterized protein LOC126971612 isoform X2 [Leptidea sinapis]|uniref:uncharacterized protein LOC126971612 isoform X1 n=1 Tax=Leptidea sinapis TaxID=189913 RepID=UPI00213DE6B4|nr:uncharacterized protein LOC126971612 isoform X1 [Leptidea sinapis]XP_050673922.1 uncharacterized protein LOC126971612 isoform X2 [Leptidea sinapis]
MLKAQYIRQAVVVSGLLFCCVSDGFIYGQMSGMIDALRADDSPIPLTEDDVSWLASTINITCIVGFIIVGVIADVLGRRIAITTLSTPVLICWIVIYYTGDKFVLQLTRVIVGVSYGGVLLLTFITIGEYVSPNIRPFCFNFMASVGSISGVTLGHILSTLMDWRKVALVGIIPTGLSCILPLLWEESPSWLASKGRFEECKKTFEALHLPSEKSNAELRNLIALEMKKKRDLLRVHSTSGSVRKNLYVLKQWYFWKIQMLSFIIGIYRVAAGRILFSTILLTMLPELTGYKDIFFCTLLVDGLGMFGAAVSCYTVSKFRMRPLLFSTGIAANFLLIILSALIYYGSTDVFSTWTKVVLLGAYYVVTFAGPYPVIDTVLGEIQPLGVKEFSLFICGSIAGVMHFVAIKIAPDMIKTIGYSGLFLVYAMFVFICLIYLWFFMPETRGRSLQEIEVFFMNGKFEDRKIFLSSEQKEDLLSV